MANRLILIGNYRPDAQESMQRFERLLETEMRRKEVDVQVIRPHTFLNNRPPSAGPMAKWLGNFDKYAIGPWDMARRIRKLAKGRQVVVHICDHSNSIYLRSIGKLPSLVTCHDAIAIQAALGEFPQIRVGRSGRALQQWIRRSLKPAPRLIGISHATIADYSRILDRPTEAFSFVPNGLNYSFRILPFEEARQRVADVSLRQDLPAEDRFLFHVGGNQWYKNRLGLIDLYDHLAEVHSECPKLILAGKEATPLLRERIQKSVNRNKILTVGRLTDVELNAFYCVAEALIFPSLIEGFGWPIIEAQASGCPVITNNRPPMNELVGSMSCLIDLNQVEAAAADIRDFLLSLNRRSGQCEQTCVSKANEFSLEKMIESYLDLYRAQWNAGLSKS